MKLQNKIIILDSVLSPEECNFLIEYYEEKGPTHLWRDTYPLNLDIFDDTITNHIIKIESAINEVLNGQIMFDWGEIVQWPKGSKQDIHVDDASKATIFTSITYLNTEYTGGETFFEDGIDVKPLLGRTLCFDGNYYYHGVKEIINGTRYTLPIWYKKDDNKQH
jgi:hypothetical protein